MKLKASLAVTVCGLMFAVALTAQDKPTGISGWWVTDAAMNALARVTVNSNVRDLVLHPSPCDPRGGGGVGGGLRFTGGQGGDCRNIAKRVDDPAVLMELKADKTTVTGTVISDYVKANNEKSDITEGKVTGTKFHFVVFKRVGEIKLKTNYDGELVAPDTITLVRTLTGGQPADKKDDGSAVTVTFHRVK